MHILLSVNVEFPSFCSSSSVLILFLLRLFPLLLPSGFSVSSADYNHNNNNAATAAANNDDFQLSLLSAFHA
jgi:hypothetical protein